MVQQSPHLIARFLGNQRQGQKSQAIDALSPFEHKFIHAIHSRQIYPVFQPITDSQLRLHGIEMLLRWQRQGIELPPGNFLPQIQSEYVWLMLTAFMLQEAVQCINQYPGDFYFSINIPPCIASHENINTMMETARQQLQQPQRAERLVLEFAETIDLHNQSQTLENIHQLQRQGFRILLDDCFSKNSVMFPVRAVNFSGYKLDMEIINDFQFDSHALALIKSLLYYCQLTSSYCIAEGVDSQKKFEQLKALGVDLFQGYLISVPLSHKNLPGLIQRFSSPENPRNLFR